MESKKVKMGENIIATVYEYEVPNRGYVLIEITGSGPMYDSVDDFEAIGDDYDDNSINAEWALQDNLVIPEGVTTIADGCFEGLGNRYTRDYGVPGVKAVVLPSTLKKIGSYAFLNNYYLENYGILTIVGGKNVEEIGDYAFQEQHKIEGLDFGFNAKRVGDGAFEECHNLKYINLSDDWKPINDVPYHIFHNCYNLTTISPNNVISRVTTGCYNCNNLSEITFNLDEEESIWNEFYVEKGAGSVLDAEGYFITTINPNSKMTDELLEFDWKGRWNRIFVIKSSGTSTELHLFHCGKHIKISCYDSGNIALTHKEMIYFLKWIELNDKQSYSDQTPLHIAHNGKWYQICY